MRRSTLFALLVLAASCDSSTHCAQDARETCTDSCRANCITADGTCEDNMQCGSGLECTKFRPEDSCFTPADQQLQCRPGEFDRLALQKGFSVGGMQIAMDRADSTLEVTWQAPRNADTVACALFACNPAFIRVGCSPTGNHELMEIANFDQCVLLFGVSPSNQLAFALINENEYQEAMQCGAAQPERRLITKLTVGCWAYDDTSLIAASELVHVSGALLSGLSTIPHDSACAANGEGCYDVDADRFGVCFQGSCAPPCKTTADCARAATSPSPAASCDWSCHAIPGNSVGACVHNAP